MWVLSIIGRFFFGLSSRVYLYGFLALLCGSLLLGAYAKGRLDCGARVNTAKLTAQIAALKAANESLRRDAEAALKDAAESAKLEAYIHELEDSIIDGDCFTDAESDRLRKLWSFGGGK